ncbi:site-specific DNA-methyltransferase [Candidatus Bathyarchaeota archaeon A05DMB-2]|jgi:DNA modification methylase|nr:site-specific DNA-methyltransferase [Candidatus Bathyarchaeota archaeon A05DMB-2]
MPENSDEQKELNKKREFGPLKATKNNDYQIEGEDWGGLKPQAAKQKLKIGDKVGEFGTFMGERGIYDSRNSLNDLTGKEWAIFTKSWFIHNPPPRSKKEILHPAKFPESVIADFIKFFTKKGELVFDPMAGTGSTLVACDKTHRKGFGIELTKKWADIAAERTSQKIIHGNAKYLKDMLNQNGINQVDFCITSPPYWNMLKKSRGGVLSLQQQRKEMGLEEYYSDSPDDLGNIEDYDIYIDELAKIYFQVYDVLRPGRYLVVIVQNILPPDGEMVPLAWDLGKKLSTKFVLKQEKIWLQDNKLLGIWGYPTRYVSNVHHHYCLIFEKNNRMVSPTQT